MNARQLKIYSTMLKNYRKGSRSDIFDLMYESSVPYEEAKGTLDILISDGVVEMVDLKTYTLIGDVEARAAEIFAANNNGKKIEETLFRIDGALDALQKDKPADDGRREEGGSGISPLIRRYREAFYRNDIVRHTDDDDDEEDDDDEDVYGDGEAVDLFNAEPSKGEKCAMEAQRYLSDLRKYFALDLNSLLDFICDQVKELDHEYIATEHLLYGIFCLGVGACVALKKVGADMELYKEHFLHAYKSNILLCGMMPEARSTIRIAIDLAGARRNNKSKARSEHLLLAILTRPHCLAVSMLRAINVDIDLLTEEVNKLIKQHNGQ